VILWFAGLAVVAVWQVFDSPAIDYRLVVVGALLPTVDVVIGRPTPLHTLLGAALVMVVVMLATRGHRLARRRLLGLPIGMLLHLVLDGTWAEADLFWWPAGGGSLQGLDTPEADRPVWLLAAMEVAGACALVWLWVRFGMSDPRRRRSLARTGRLPREA